MFFQAVAAFLLYQQQTNGVCGEVLPRKQRRMQLGVCLKCALMTRINLTL